MSDDDRGRPRTRRVVIVNTVMAIPATIGAMLVLVGGVMGGAAAGGSLGAAIAMMSMALPALPAISVLGSWLTLRWPRVALSFVALPWVWFAVLLVVTAVLFQTGP